MKKIILFLMFTALVGCADTIRSYVEEPQTILRDPHYAQYQEDAKTLERSYLDGQITYAVYLERKKQLDDKYNKEVMERESMISGE